MAEKNETTTCYTTGELAEVCGTTVRTVQYYDGKGLLAPSDYSEGGRRLYTDEDVRQLHFILMLKALGLSLAQIKGVLESPRRHVILGDLLNENARELREETEALQERLRTIETMADDLARYGALTATSKLAMVRRMEDKRAERRWHGVMLGVGFLMDVAWIGTLVLGILTGIWWPFPVALVAVAAAAFWLVFRTNDHTTYLCPVCRAEFRPKLGAFFIARHTPSTRKLTCPCCGEKDWCVERFHADPVPIGRGECVPGTCTHGACAKGEGGVR